MPNYRENAVTGSAYTRAFEVIIANPLDGDKFIRFNEEDILNVNGDAFPIVRGNVTQLFTPENAHTTFDLVNPETGELTGQTASFGEAYALLHSLYLATAKKRDEEAPSA